MTDLSSLVLCNFVLSVLLAIFSLAIGAARFGYVNLLIIFINSGHYNGFP